MTFPLGRAAVSLMLAPYIALSTMAVAPDHRHEADAGHPHAVVHRHLQPHAAATDDHDHDHARLADDEEQILWLANVALRQNGYQYSAVAPLPAQMSSAVPAVIAWVTLPDYDASPPHGPPKACLSLRAPPRLSA